MTLIKKKCRPAPTLTCVLLLMVLSACAPLRTPPIPDSDAEWQLSGRAGLWYGDQQESANLEWLNCQQHFRIRLSGSLGFGAAILTGNSDEVRLERSGHDTVNADNPEILARQMGWPLPVSALEHWLRGQPVPRQTATVELAEDGNLHILQQMGWEIRYADYQRHGSFQLPSRLDAENDELRIRLIIRRWQLQPEACTRAS